MKSDDRMLNIFCQDRRSRLVTSKIQNSKFKSQLKSVGIQRPTDTPAIEKQGAH